MKCPPVRLGMQLAHRKGAKGCFRAHKAGGHLPAFDRSCAKTRVVRA